ncbi:hypothetical protein MMC34_007686 [Xylographa carneopallida]|nr:hypothetical protein [Xylographa carneopallida]
MAAQAQGWSLYPYDPIKPLPITFAVIIFLVASVQIYQCLAKYRWRRFYATMTIASATWIAGFACRAMSIYHVQSVGPFIAQYILLFVGAPLYAGAEYFILGRVLAYVPYYSPIHPGRVLSTFILLDAVVEALAANGAATYAVSKTLQARDAGLIRIELALILQCCLEVCFFLLVVLVEIRCRRARRFPSNIRTICYVLYVTSAMMLVRCIFRAIDGFESADCAFDDPGCAVVDRYEWPFWVFEVANITLYVVVLAIFPPGKYLPHNDKVYLDPVEEGTERIGPGYAQADKRNILVTILDPFDLGAVVLGKTKAVDKFWERDNIVYKSTSIDMEAGARNQTR